MSLNDSGIRGSREFPDTSWSIILKATDSSSPEYERHLERLVKAYWRPVYRVVQHRTASQEDAKDLTQEFFATVVFDRQLLKSSSPERGSFRDAAAHGDRSVHDRCGSNREPGQARGRRAHEHRLRPPEMDPLEFLLRRVRWRYAKGRPASGRGVVHLGDATSVLPRLGRLPAEAKASARLLFTSPPYFGITNYHYDQWLRLWVRGGRPDARRSGEPSRGKV